MNPKYLVLYLAAGTIALIMVIYQLITTHGEFNTERCVLNSAIGLFFYYLAYKTYHEKKDKELM
jgi:hypothetical protein